MRFHTALLVYSHFRILAITIIWPIRLVFLRQGVNDVPYELLPFRNVLYHLFLSYCMSLIDHFYPSNKSYPNFFIFSSVSENSASLFSLGFCFYSFIVLGTWLINLFPPEFIYVWSFAFLFGLIDYFFLLCLFGSFDFYSIIS